VVVDAEQEGIGGGPRGPRERLYVADDVLHGEPVSRLWAAERNPAPASTTTEGWPLGSAAATIAACARRPPEVCSPYGHCRGPCHPRRPRHPGPPPRRRDPGVPLGPRRGRRGCLPLRPAHGSPHVHARRRGRALRHGGGLPPRIVLPRHLAL